MSNLLIFRKDKKRERKRVRGGDRKRIIDRQREGRKIERVRSGKRIIDKERKNRECRK